MDAKRPKRAYQFTIEVGADTPQEMAWSLQQIASDIKDNINHQSVCGGPSGGWVVTPDHTPAKTHDEYIAELDAYLAQRDQQKQQPMTPPPPSMPVPENVTISEVDQRPVR